MKKDKKKSSNLFREHWLQFRDELIATGVVAVVAVAGSFFLLAQNGFFAPVEEEVVAEQAEASPGSDQAQVLGVQNNELEEISQSQAAPTSTPTPTPSPTPSATSQTVVTAGTSSVNDQPYQVQISNGEIFDLPEYRITFSNLRLVVNDKNKTRQFLVDVVLANKDYAQGLQNRLLASLVKDGAEIVSEAAMSVSESKTVYPGQKLTFTASINLFDGTDVKWIYFRPSASGIEKVDYLVIP